MPLRLVWNTITSASRLAAITMMVMNLVMVLRVSVEDRSSRSRRFSSLAEDRSVLSSGACISPPQLEHDPPRFSYCDNRPIEMKLVREPARRKRRVPGSVALVPSNRVRRASWISGYRQNRERVVRRSWCRHQELYLGPTYFISVG